MQVGEDPLNDELWCREMPEPLAELYGLLRAGAPEQRFERLKNLGEFAVHFATVLALASATRNTTTPASYAAWCQRLLPLELGTSLHILAEVLASTTDDFCPELRVWHDSPKVRGALLRLRDDRNIDSHGAGAAGRQAVVKAGEELAAQVLPALRGLEFLSAYSLGYIISCEARRGGGWRGLWHGWRGEQRSDDDGPVGGTAAAAPLCHEVLLVDPSGKRGLSLSPLLAVVPFAKRDRLAILRKLGSGPSSTGGIYARPIELSKTESQAFDAEQPVTWSTYSQTPQRWHGQRALELDPESLQKIRGIRYQKSVYSRLRLGTAASGPRGQRGWVAEILDDSGTVLAFPLPPRLAQDAQRRAATVEQLRSLAEPGLPRLLSLERSEDRYLLTFERVNGQDLSRWLAEHGSLGPRDAAVMLVGLLEALSEAHRVGLWHGAVTTESLVVTPSGRLRLLQPLLPPDEVSDATTRQSLQLVDAVGAPILVSDFGLDVAGAASVLARLCGVAFRLGQRPPDLASEAAATPRPLAMWFDRAARRSWSFEPFATAGEALESLREVLGRPSAAARSVSALPQAAISATATQAADKPTTALSVGPSDRVKSVTIITPSGDGATLESGLADDVAAAPPPAKGASATAQRPATHLWRALAGTLALVIGLAVVTVIYTRWTTTREAGQPPRQQPTARSAEAAERGPNTAPWSTFVGFLPRAGLADQLQSQARLPALRDLLRLPTAQVDELTKPMVKSDVRSDLFIRKFLAPSGDKASFILVERDDHQLQRLGTWFTPRQDSSCAGMADRLPQPTTTWQLDCGGEVRWYAVDGVWLHFYVPPGKGTCEWWLYPRDASADPTERKIANAFSCNDAGQAAWDEMDAETALKLFRQAVTTLPNYAKAAGRGCVVASYLRQATPDLCAAAASSNFPEMRACVGTLPRQVDLGGKLCP